MSNDTDAEKAVAADPTPTLGNAIHLRNQAAAMLEEAARIDRLVAAEELRRREERKPKQPDLGDAGSVAVTFTKYQAGREYAYAAVGWRVGQSTRWTVTGQNTDRLNWPGLLQFIGEANWPSLHVVVGLKRIGPDPAEEEPVAERMGSYGRVAGTYSPGGVVDPLVRAEVPRVGTGPSPFDQPGRGFIIAALRDRDTY
ncbi:hypothetical protein SEA_VINCENZO_89 [Mycobacterium phage Vincenzo]|uniref:Uncharacterized protein n=2 Tax=Coopervirus vincenzo TaxID=1983110 RepID=A0A0F6YQ33_9CAUD|nr:hypothetical protein SEA_VINCENZO_89 [Mycobacterium phage Vincenzo]AKF14351.1 hypothetical protein SEA_VINCENZO_89 [Mycobacterium phage Vincenzo]AKF14755.1 hypothetical protein SEA_ALANGRANT_90 [Mycobacterium phage AlanGrant]